MPRFGDSYTAAPPIKAIFIGVKRGVSNGGLDAQVDGSQGAGIRQPPPLASFMLCENIADFLRGKICQTLLKKFVSMG